MLEFKDGTNWLEMRINGVKKAYKIPSDINGGIAIDVGANVGAFPVVNSTRFDKIICIEPSKNTIKELKGNIGNHKVTNVDILHNAVGATDGDIVKLRHFKDGASSGNATTLNDAKWYNPNDYEEVKTISLESIKKLANGPIEYLKVDCEGGEFDLLMNKDLSNIKYIGIEIHLQLGDNMKVLMGYLNQFYDIISTHGNGTTMHYEITYKRKD